MKIIYDVVQDKYQSNTLMKTPKSAKKGKYFSTKLLQNNAKHLNPLANFMLKINKSGNETSSVNKV